MKDLIISYLKSRPGRSASLKGLARHLGLRGKQQSQLRAEVKRLVAAGQLVEDSRHRVVYGGGESAGSRKSAAPGKQVEGRISVTRGGYGFVAVEGMDDVFVARRDLRSAAYGDLVKVQLLGRRPRGPAGKVLQVLERGRNSLVGTVIEVPGGFELVFPEPLANRAVRLNKATVSKNDAGSLVYAQVTDWGDSSTAIRADVLEVIGPANDPLSDFKLVLRQHDLDEAFPAQVEAETARQAGAVKVDSSDGRRDLRSWKVITIDPQSAKDFDDALSLQQRPDGTWLLGVHIADVTLYVTPGSHIDSEARIRGNSVYFTEGMVPMLPHQLSSDLCSLRPAVDRPAVSALIQLTGDGEVLGVEFARTLIHNRRRFTYQEAHAILERGTGKWFDLLGSLRKLTRALFDRRISAGSIDFDIPEPLIELDPAGVPHTIRPSQRLDSHRLVEECMLLANRLVAERVPGGKPRKPFIYRVHDEPGREQIQKLTLLLRRLQLPILPAGEITSARVRDLLEAMEDSPYRDLIETITLRSMAKATYSANNIGHFGLAFTHYTHFTSPIRRYADLVVHRLLVQQFNGSGPSPQYSVEELAKVAANCSEREQLALKAERTYRRLKELRFLATQIGKRFDGIISGVIPKGVFVQIREFLIDGFVGTEWLDDDEYVYDEAGYALRGRRGGRVLQLGQEVYIQVRDVSITNRYADFILLARPSGEKKK